MRYELSPKCDFSEIPAFAEKCEAVFRPYAERGAWDDVAGIAFYSNYTQGMLPLSCRIKDKTLESAISDEETCRWLVCCQRGVLTVCEALGKVCPPDYVKPLLRDFYSLFPALCGGKDLEAAFAEWRGLMDTVNVWICAHGGDSYTIRTQVSSRCLKKLYQLEKQYGGKAFGAAVAGFVAIGYRVFLDRVFWPAYHVHEKSAEARSVYSDAGFSAKIEP